MADETFGQPFRPEQEQGQVQEQVEQVVDKGQEGDQSQGQEKAEKEDVQFGQKFTEREQQEESEQGVQKEEVSTERGQEEKVDEDSFDIKEFFKNNEREFKGQEDLEQLFEKEREVTDLQKQLNDAKEKYESLSEKYENFKQYEDGVDPLGPFGGDENLYKFAQYKKDNPDKNPSIVYEAFTSDFSKVDDLDVLVKYNRLSDDTLGEEATKELILNEYGIEPENINNPEEWTSIQKNRIKKDANSARKEFNEIKGSVELPEKKDLVAQNQKAKEEAQAKKEANKQEWSKVVDSMMNDLNKIPVMDDPDKEGKQEKLIDFELSQDIKDGLKEDVVDYLTDNNMEVNEDNAQRAYEVAIAKVFISNLPKLMKLYKSEGLAEQEKAHNDEIHNPKKPKIEEKPQTTDEPDGFGQAFGSNNVLGNKLFKR